MSTALIVYLLIAGTLLALGAHAVASALSLAGRATRWVWAATLVGILALGLVAPLTRSLSVVTTTGAMPAAAVSHPQAAAPSSIVVLIQAVRGSVESTVVRSIAVTSGRIPPFVARPAAIGWLLASALLLAIYLTVNFRVSRARRQWPLERLQGVDVRVAPSAGPAVIGVVRAEIVVPRSLLERSDEEQRLILAHEHEHLRARDNLLLGLACAVVIVLPWHPAVWYILARLRLAIELDCDARVLRRGAAPRAYGELLIDMAARGAGIRVGTLALADRPSHLERRLLAMKTTRSRFMLVRGGALSAMAGLLVLGACEAKIPTAAEIDAMDVGKLESAGASSGMFGKFDNADFLVDGVWKSREEALAIDAKMIGSVEVVKGGRDTIIVTSKDLMKKLETAGPLRVQVDELRNDSSSSKIRVPMPVGANGSQPSFMIDGVLASAADVAALRPEYVRSVEVTKPSGSTADPRYPNGLVVIKTGSTPIAPKMRIPTPASVERVDEVKSPSDQGTTNDRR